MIKKYLAWLIGLPCAFLSTKLYWKWWEWYRGICSNLPKAKQIKKVD